MSTEEKTQTEENGVEKVDLDIAPVETESNVLEAEINAAIEDSMEVVKDGDDTAADKGEADKDTGVEGEENSEEEGVEDGVKDSEGSTEDGESEKEDTTVVSVAPVISSDAITRAVRAGLSLDDAQSFKDEATLNRIVGGMEGNKAKDVAEKKEDIKVEELFAEMPKLDPDAYDPEVISMFDKIMDTVKGQSELIMNLQAEQVNTASAATDAASKEVEHWFDKSVEGMGEDFQEALGVGNFRDLKPGSVEYINRDKVSVHLGILMQGHIALGGEMPSREVLFEQATRATLGDVYQGISESSLSAKLKDRSSQHIQRTSGSKKTVKQTPEEHTAALVDEMFS